MSCDARWAHEALDALATGELEPKSYGRLLDHVQSCESCREQHERITRLDRARGRALSPERVALLENVLMAKVPQPRRSLASMWVPVASFAAMAALGVFFLFAPKALPTKDDFLARGGHDASASYGLRAFCVEPGNGPPRVVSEAQPGGKLKCGKGNALQLTYTSPGAARLSIDVRQGTGKTDSLFPIAGGDPAVASGVDVPLGFSVPVGPTWLPAQATVVGHFADANGKTIAESQITIEP